MFYAVSLFLFLATSPTVVQSLQCRKCPAVLAFNYIVTSDTLPSFDHCPLSTAEQCMTTIFWTQNPGLTFISLNFNANPLPPDSLHDFVIAIAQMQLASDNKTRTVQSDLVYGCTLSDECNGQTNLKRLLDSLVIQENFLTELSPLIENVESFDNDSASTCQVFTNSTQNCLPNDFDNCQRCQTFVDQVPSGSDEVCANCPNTPQKDNSVMRQSFFILNNRTRNDDRVILQCQLNGCNSLENIQKIRRSSTITFDFAKFFDDSTSTSASTSTATTTTTTSDSTSSTTTPGSTSSTTTPGSTSSSIVSISKLAIILAAMIPFSSIIV